MSNREPFGQRVKARRRELGLTQEELAHRVGCAPITLRKVEHDDLRPSVQIAERLAMALIISLEERAAFVRLARAERALEPLTSTPTPKPEEIGLEDLSGRAIRGYALGERLGEGGMGVVYRATQPLVERQVAIKIILPQYANQPDFIRRFEAEAQLIARLEHPHIVPLYDYWREPGVAYLVMRLLRGGSLRTLLEHGALPLDLVDRLIEQISLALAAAHRVGVVHRDLKPANILLDEDHNAYLADFGIAKNLGNIDELTPADARVGTPDYISPEQIRSEFVRPQTDIYCLGVMLYELLTGALPFQGPTPIDVMHSHLTAPLPPLAVRHVGLPAALDKVIARATVKDPLDRYPDAEALLADWQRALSGTSAARDSAPAKVLTDADNPYKGLRAFGEGDAADFFGRDALIQQLLARLGEGGDLARFLAVVGPSGCGKSSVVKAGLIPALRRGGLPGSDKWFIVELQPGLHPLEALGAALRRIAVNPPESLVGQLREDKRGLLRAVSRCLPDDPEVELVLVIDQFEELFTLVQDETARAHLLDSLVTAALDEGSRLRLVVTLRADFIDRPLNYVDFGEMLRQRMEVVLPFTPEELERAITCPAERVGAEWEPGLVAAIMHDVGDQPGALPLLQYALTGLFEKRDGHRLTKAAYQSIGGVLGALGRRAEEVYTGLDKNAQAAARQLCLRLVALGEGAEETRRRVLRSELMSISTPAGSENQMAAVIEMFGRHRLLAFDRDPMTRGATVEVAHEALLREWPRLRDWLSASRADVRLQRQLALAADDWQSADHETSFLLTGARLAQFEGWAAGTDLALTRAERTFLDAGVAQRRAQEAAEAARQKRELDAAKRAAEAAQTLAETEKQRAEEQTRSAARLRQRAVYLVLALGTALVLLIATLGLAHLSNQNLVAANAANTQAVAEVHNRSTAEANAQAEAYSRATAQALAQGERNSAQAEAYSRATAEVQAQGERNAALNAQATAQAETQVRATAEANAVQARTNAEQQAALAFARELDAAAELQLSADPQLSLLLALQAVSVTHAAGLGDPLDVQQTLHNIMPAQRLLWTQSVPYWPIKVAYSSDGKRITVVDGTGNISATTYILDAATRQTLLTVNGYGFAYSPDEKLLATGDCTSSGPYQVYVWDAITGRQLITLTGQTAAVCGFAFSPDGNTLATGGEEGVARVWDLRAWRAAGEPAGTIISQTAKILGCYSRKYYYGGINFSPDGKRLVTVCDEDNTAKVWDMPSGRLVFSLTGHADIVLDADFSPDGKSLGTVSADGTARLWDATTGKELLRLNPGKSEFMNLAFSPDGQYLATSSREFAIVWDANIGTRLFDLPNPYDVMDVAFSPDGQRLLTTVNGAIQAWDVTPSGPGELAIMAREWWYDFNNSRDGSRFADITEDGILRLYNSVTLQELWATKIFTPPIWNADGISLSADNTLLSASVDNTVTVWNADSGQSLFELVQPDNVREAALSPDGRRLAVGLDNGEIVLWDLGTQKPLQTLTTTMGCITSIEFNPDGTRLAAAGSLEKLFCAGGGIAYLWDLAGGTKQISAPMQLRFDSRTIYHVNFSPDGRRLAASGYRGAAVWEWATGQLVFTMTAHTSYIFDINYSPDGKYLVTASYDKTAKVWDAQTGKELLSYPSPTYAYKAFFAPNGRGIVLTGSGPSRLNAFLNFDDLVAAAHQRLLRDWQPGECLKYLHSETCPGRP